MANEPEKIEHHHVKETVDPKSRIFVLCAGALMVAAITFGLLNTFHVIHL